MGDSVLATVSPSTDSSKPTTKTTGTDGIKKQTDYRRKSSQATFSYSFIINSYQPADDMFADNNLGVMGFAITDTCNAPITQEAVPIPLPNIALTSTSIPTVFNTFVSGMPITMDGGPLGSAIDQIFGDSSAIHQLLSLNAASNADGIVAHVNFNRPIGSAKVESNGKTTDFQVSRLVIHLEPDPNGSDPVIKSIVPCEKQMPATKLTSVNTQSSSNVVGQTLSPSQVRVITLQ